MTASVASRSEYPYRAWSTNTAAITSAGTDGRPRAERNKSANISSGNNASRCSARNANTLPSSSNSPAIDSASNRSR